MTHFGVHGSVTPTFGTTTSFRQPVSPAWVTIFWRKSLLFIYFIQRKYWLGKKADFLYRFWQAYQQSGQKKDTFTSAGLPFYF
ncbi:hypothetical protein NXS98_07365 [Fontisphaera persica]|uniref:hypothetical protein n=1 Tax=Fontisphaera persica TaxID=2974023 RepID=UPI0024C09694|nr:hypothetical protein [Fontisphaera persica]WCJ60928.1 hypothetical protein NXS98_07365 [Fontisphaera persica]